MLDDRTLEITKKIEGKTIKCVRFTSTWREDEIATLSLFFTDGTRLHLSALDDDAEVDRCDYIALSLFE